jgi:hypothetical protein
MKRTLAVLVALSMLLGAASVARAQSTIEVTNSTAKSSFPEGITFTLDATTGGSVNDIRLIYQVAPDGVRVTNVPQCTSGASVHCTFIFANSRGYPLFPGAEVTYFWRINAAGATQESQPQTVTYEDSRFDWQTITEGNVTIWWYSGGEAEARTVLEAGRDSLGRNSALLKTQVTFPVKIFYYASAQAMQPAIVADNAAGVITLGEAAYSDTVMVAADAQPQDVARHEVAHIVVRQAVRGPYEDNVPRWLNEGTAVFAQSQPLEGQRQAIESAIRSGQVISVRSMSSASSGALSDRVFLFYGESWSLVKFLVDTYGNDAFAQLFAALKQGATTAQALEQVYSFDQDGLENVWRASVGLPPRQPVTPEAAAGQATPSPTDTANTSGNGGGAPVGVIAAIIVVTVLLAAGLAGAGVFLARRYR